MSTTRIAKHLDRRTKARFPLHREMRYKILENGVKVQTGNGQTLDISSGGIAFAIDREVEPETYVELSVSWPVLLHDDCPMQLIILGRMLRSGPGRSVCTVDKYEFRTRGKVLLAGSKDRLAEKRMKQWTGPVPNEAKPLGHRQCLA